MSTRCRIGIEKDGKITSIYLHNDGYLEYAGKILKTYYTTEESINKLISLGNMSVIGITPEDSGFENPLEEAEGTLYYAKCKCYIGREDTPWAEVAPEVAETRDAFIERVLDAWGEFAYLFANGKWYYCTVSQSGHSWWQEV